MIATSSLYKSKEQVIVVAQILLFVFHLFKEWPYCVGKRTEGLCIHFQGSLWTLRVTNCESLKKINFPLPRAGPTLNCSLMLFSGGGTARCGCMCHFGRGCWASVELKELALNIRWQSRSLVQSHGKTWWEMVWKYGKSCSHWVGFNSPRCNQLKGIQLIGTGNHQGWIPTQRCLAVSPEYGKDLDNSLDIQLFGLN